MMISLVAAAALMPAVVSAQATTRHVFADVTRPSGAAEVDLRVEDFEVTEGGERREIVSAKMTRRPARLLLVVDSTDGIRQPAGLVLTALTMIGRDTGGAFTNISPNGLLEVMERLAAVINEAYTNAPPIYQIEFASAPPTGKQPLAPQVRVRREGLRLSVISTP